MNKFTAWLTLLLFSILAGCGGGSRSTPPAPVETTYNVSGTVTESGGALSDVTITVTGTASPTPVKTDASGNYTVSLGDGSYTVTASKTGYTFIPNSTPVTMAGVAVPRTNFAATANTAVQAVISGTVTGPWREGVTVNMTDGTTGSTILIGTTGNYSFTVASGASYTFSASLPGYTFATQTVSVAAGSAAAVTVPAILGAPVVAFTTISGTVIYAGAKSSPVIVSVASSGNPNVIQWKTRILLADGSGLYTIRGLPIGSYIVKAGMVASVTGEPNASDPVAPPLTAFTTGGNATEVNLLLADPAASVTPVVPTLISVSPASAAAFVLFTPPANGNQELATAYKIYWSTNADATTGGSSAIFPATGTANGGFALVKGLTEGSALYFKINALVGTTESASSAVTSSPVTIGAVAGGNTVSGTVATSGLGEVTTGARMIVGLYNQATRATYFSTYTPAASVNYSITGVPAGTYYNFAIIDMNGNGVVDTGDVSNIKDGTTVTVVVGTNTANLTLSSAPKLSVTTYYRESGKFYNLVVKSADGAKRVVGVTLYAGPNVAVPRDMAASPGNDGFVFLQATAGFAATPLVGDVYGFKVFFSDGTSKLMSSSVTGVLGANVPTGLTTSPTAAGATVAAPQFSWAAPAVTPTALPYVYNLGLQPTSGSGPTWWMESMSSSQLSVLYNANGNASASTLTKDANTWFVQVKDVNGNIAQSLNALY